MLALSKSSQLTPDTGIRTLLLRHRMHSAWLPTCSNEEEKDGHDDHEPGNVLDLLPPAYSQVNAFSSYATNECSRHCPATNWPSILFLVLASVQCLASPCKALAGLMECCRRSRTLQNDIYRPASAQLPQSPRLGYSTHISRRVWPVTGMRG